VGLLLHERRHELLESREHRRVVCVGALWPVERDDNDRAAAGHAEGWDLDQTGVGRQVWQGGQVLLEQR